MPLFPPPAGSSNPAPGPGSTVNSYLNLNTAHTAVVKSSAGKIYSLSCHNTGQAEHYIQLHNKTTAAVGGDVPVAVFPVIPQTTSIIGNDYFTGGGFAFSNGIVFAVSATELIYTQPGAIEHVTQIEYE